MTRAATAEHAADQPTNRVPPRVYRSLAAVALRNLLAYPTAFLFALLASTFGTLAMLYLWRAVLSSGHQAAGFDWPQMKAYLLVTYLTGSMVSSYTDYRMAERIRSGDVALELVKPVDYQRARFAEAVGVAVYEAGTALVAVSAMVLLFGGVPLPAGHAVGLLAVSLALVLPLRFGIVYASSLATFWTHNYIGVNATRIALVTLLSGALVPLAFFPDWVQRITMLLPFAGMASTPALVYIGRLDGWAAVGSVAVQAAWAIGLWGLTRSLWTRASRQLTVHGG